MESMATGSKVIQSYIKNELGLGGAPDHVSSALNMDNLDKLELPGSNSQLRGIYGKLRRCECDGSGSKTAE
jgi:hypothetical protein